METINTKMTAKGVIIDFDWEHNFEAIKNSLKDHFEEAGSFYEGTDLYFKVGTKELELNNFKELFEIAENYLSSETGIYLVGQEDNKERLNSSKESQPKREPIIEEVSFKGDTVLVKGTIRSGQAVEHPHNLVIMGDVNPGAEVKAGGDIIVFGRLMGLVHAGAGGKKDAQVAALRLTPTQIRIANKISRPPEDSNDQIFSPEKAFIKEERIIVEEIDF